MNICTHFMCQGRCNYLMRYESALSVVYILWSFLSCFQAMFVKLTVAIRNLEVGFCYESIRQFLTKKVSISFHVLRITYRGLEYWFQFVIQRLAISGKSSYGGKIFSGFLQLC